ncbi:MAG: MFS transporter [Acidimicrobiales bacterium]|nr:MFS transporter [Acidimicrobiales bacterium]
MTSPTVRPTLLTPRFVALVSGVTLYFLGLNMTLSVLPLFVEGELGGTDAQVGIAVSSFGLAAACIRPIIGPLGDRHGRQRLIVSGAIVAGLATIATATAASLGMVIAFRALAGLGEAAMFVGAASAAQDLATDERRGEAASYFSLAIYSSLFLGPPLGEWISETFGTDTAWVLAGGLAVVAASTGIVAPGAPAEPPPKPERRVLLHRAALRPGAVLFLGLLGYTGFLAFAALHAEEVGIANTGTVFTVFALVIIFLRIFAAKLPDQLGPVRTSRISLSCGAIGLAVLAVWTEPVGVYVGAAILAVAQSFLFPALFALVVDDAPDAERSHAISTLSMFFDLAFGLGGPVIGLVSDTFDRSTAFAVSAGIATFALAMCGRILGDVAPSTSVREIGPRSRR